LAWLAVSPAGHLVLAWCLCLRSFLFIYRSFLLFFVLFRKIFFRKGKIGVARARKNSIYCIATQLHTFSLTCKNKKGEIL
jgi:hypothetical protein